LGTGVSYSTSAESKCLGLNNTLIGPFFIEGNLNAAIYEDMLRNQIVPVIRAIVDENTILRTLDSNRIVLRHITEEMSITI